MENETEPHVVNEDRFSVIPEGLLYDVAISADAVRVYGVLRRHGDDPSNCFPSHARIAGLIGRSSRSINGWVRELEEAGWIERIPRVSPNGDPDSNGYRVFLLPKGRAEERGVRAGERGGVRAAERGGSAPESAPNESKLNESKMEGTSVAVGRAAERAEATRRFDAHFWPAYPPRNGKRLDKAKALAQWLRLSIDEQRAAVKGARNYGASGQIPKDAHRWLRDKCWQDWQTPASGAPPHANARQAGLAAVIEELREELG